jgi:hypothetical protein
MDIGTFTVCVGTAAPGCPAERKLRNFDASHDSDS